MIQLLVFYSLHLIIIITIIIITIIIILYLILRYIDTFLLSYPLFSFIKMCSLNLDFCIQTGRRKNLISLIVSIFGVSLRVSQGTKIRDLTQSFN